MAIAEITDNVNDLVEVQRGYYNLFLMSIDSVNLNDIVKYGEGLVLLDESNYECIYATLIDLILSEELTFQEKILLCQKLFQSQSFCIVSEEILELIVLNEVNTLNKIEGFSLMKKLMNVEYITQIEEQIPIEKE